MININQKKIFYDCIKYLKYLKKKNIDYSSSGLAYFCTWSNTIGYYKIKSIVLKKKIKFIYELIKNFIKIGYFSNYELDFNFKSKNNNLFIAWSSNKSLNKSLYTSNRYISGFHKEKKRGSWFLVHEEEYKKKHNLRDVCLLKRKKIFFNFFFLLNETFKSLKINKLNLLKNVHSLNSECVFSKIVETKIIEILKRNRIKKVIISYEAQPFQKNLIKKIKTTFPDIKIYCDIHSLQPSYLHLIDLDYLADCYISHNKDQKNFLINFLKINKKKVLFKKISISQKKKGFYGKIFLPYNLNNLKLIIKSLKFLEKKKIINLNDFTLKPHPVALNDLTYRTKYLKLMKAFSFDKSLSKKVLIIGNTNILFEALELNLDLIHITTDTICDQINTFFWKNILKIKLNSSNIYKYKLKKNKIKLIQR